MKHSVLNHEPITIQAPPTTNKHLVRWVEKMADLCQPASIHWVDGSQAEYDFLCDRLVESGTFMRLDESGRSSCHSSLGAGFQPILPAWGTPVDGRAASGHNSPPRLPAPIPCIP